ncbi:hypothetical protein [Streptomyces variabilis]
MLVEVKVCDRCRRIGVPTRSYTLAEGGRSATTDRCADHDEAFEEVLAQGETPPVEEPSPAEKPAARKRAASKETAKAAAKKTTAKKAASRPRSRTPVMTVEEIEAMKQGKQ